MQTRQMRGTQRKDLVASRTTSRKRGQNFVDMAIVILVILLILYGVYRYVTYIKGSIG